MLAVGGQSLGCGEDRSFPSHSSFLSGLNPKLTATGRISTKPNCSRSSVRRPNSGKTSACASRRPCAERSRPGRTSSCASTPNERASWTNCPRHPPPHRPHKRRSPPARPSASRHWGATPSLTSSATTKRGVSASASASSSTTARADNKHRPHPAHSPTKAGPLLPRLVRRVQAVIEVPVKEEPEGEDGEGLLDPADIERPDPAVPRRTSAPAGTAVGVGDGGTGGSHRRGARRRKFSASASASASASSHRRSLVAPPDEEGYVDGEEPPSDEAEDGEYVDEEEVADAIADGTPPSAVGRKAVPWGRKHIRHEPDEEDDELMMYAKVRQDNPHKVHPLRENHPPQPPRLKSITDVATPRVSATNASAQKRKTMEMGSGCMMRTKRRR
ncbi:hypothetical protein F5148DRAFT_554253 [Russula earlei]|uniref:Uncharacterized protein n=1 Tax=Russula earlei TaxID=71964 RepID=A0ACC0UHL3_9AGAM|nr:hypothetical protein F5148DRAFT_554253 [Russula earlei]